MNVAACERPLFSPPPLSGPVFPMCSSRGSFPHPRVALLILCGLVACGDGGTGPGSSVPTSIEVTTLDLRFEEALSTHQISAAVLDQHGQPMPSASITYTVGREAIASVDAGGLITALANGSTTVTIRSGSATASVSVEVDVTPIDLALEQAITIASPENGYRYYAIDVPARTDGQVLEVRLFGGTGDADLYLRFGSKVGFGLWDCGSDALLLNLDLLEACSIRSPQPGTWHVAVEAFSAYGGVTLQASLVPVSTLADGIPQTGIHGERLSLRYYSIDVPAGSALSLTTDLGSGDPDLFGADVPVFAFPRLYDGACASFEDGTAELCAIDARTEDEAWTVVIFGFEAYSGVSLTADVGA